MTSAETQPVDSGAPAPAAGELSIPKHRFDEVAAEVRRLREEIGLKDQLYTAERLRQAQPVEPEINLEDYGLDPQSGKGIAKLVEKLADKKIAQVRQVYDQQFGHLANRTEKAELVASKGPKAAEKYHEIERMKQDHWQRTGGFLPAETAYDLIRLRDAEEKVRSLEAKLAGKPAATPNDEPTTEESVSAPRAVGTRTIPGGAPPANPSAKKNFSEMSVAEMEAHLEGQFKEGTTL